MGKKLNVLGAPFWQIQAKGPGDRGWMNVCTETYEIGNFEDQERARKRADHAKQVWSRQERYSDHQWRVVPGEN